MARLTESDEITIERPNVTLRLTINPRRGLTGVSVGDIPSCIVQLADDLKSLSDALSAEAREVADAAESKAAELGSAFNDEIVASHTDARKITTDSNGSSCYLRVVMTSTRPVPQLTMFMLVDALLEYFKEYVSSMIKMKAAGPPTVTLANLGAVALASSGPLGDIARSDELQIGDRA